MEYAGDQDPDLDIAMFCIYSDLNRERIDYIIDLYFDNNCGILTRYKIYAYIAIAGLLWSIWCAVKMENDSDEMQSLFDYAQSQFKFAKDYSKLVKEYINAQN